MAWKNGRRRQMMTKTIEEQIAEAREDLTFARWTVAVGRDSGAMALGIASRAHDRMLARAASRLATIEAVRDGRMVPVYATVCADLGEPRGWYAYGAYGEQPQGSFVLHMANHADTDVVTILRGYAHVPSTQVHEVEADSEVPS